MKFPFFTYGTLQVGFPNHAQYADLLGTCVGRYRTVERYPLVIPRRAACPNAGCSLDHRICALLDQPGTGFQVEGEVYRLAPTSLEKLDLLEKYDPADELRSVYLRRTVWVEPEMTSGDPIDCQAYFIADASGYQSLLQRGGAEMVTRYTAEMARGRLKPCCVERPGHPGPHVVSNPFAVD